MADAVLTLTQGEKRMVYGAVSGISPITITGASWTLESSGSPIAGMGGACISIDPPGTEVSAGGLLDTSTLTANASYDMVFTMTDSNGYVYVCVVRIILESV